MNIELKNIKTHPDMSQATTCFSATLYINGTKVAQVQNDGRGGCHNYYFQDYNLEKQFKDYCKSLPQITLEADEDFPELKLNMDADHFVDDLIDKHEEQKYLKKNCKKKVMFQLKDDKKNYWRTYNATFNPKEKEYLVKTYGTKLKRIANEEV